MSASVGVEKIFSLCNVTMNFGNVVAIQDVVFEVAPGEIVGLVGDNGAGKSTLVKIMNGFHTPSRGTMEFMGEQVTSPPRAMRASPELRPSIRIFALIPALSIWRNFFLGRELNFGRWPLKFLDKKRMRQITMENLREMGLTELRSPDEPVDILSGGERQALAIARARYFGGALLLLDEPTSALSVKETEKVSEAVQIARNSGLGWSSSTTTSRMCTESATGS